MSTKQNGPSQRISFYSMRTHNTYSIQCMCEITHACPHLHVRQQNTGWMPLRVLQVRAQENKPLQWLNLFLFYSDEDHWIHSWVYLQLCLEKKGISSILRHLKEKLLGLNFCLSWIFWFVSSISTNIWYCCHQYW